MIDIPDSIFPVSEKGESLCPQCQRTVSTCTCPTFDPQQPRDLCVRMRLDKKGRQGKTVTLIEGLPADLEFVKALAKRLKQKCGAGGTYLIQGAEAYIEIQGNNLGKIRQFLSAEDIQVES